MIWNRAIFFGILLVFTRLAAQTPPSAIQSEIRIPIFPATPAEATSYSCAKNITSLFKVDAQAGPMFGEGRLIFTSLETKEGKPLLLVNDGNGIYAIRLKDTSMQRLRFTIESADRKFSHTYYLSYMHGGMMPARYFDYSQDQVPANREVSDYKLVTVERKPELRDHFNFALQKTAQAVVPSMSSGKIERQPAAARSINGCKKLIATDRKISATFRHDISTFELLNDFSYARRRPAQKTGDL